MTRSELIKRFLEKYPDSCLNEEIYSKVFDIIFGSIKQTLIEHGRAEFRGFGAFSVKKRSARTARNPKNNQKVDLNTRYVPYFRAGKKLFDQLNKTSPWSNK